MIGICIARSQPASRYGPPNRQQTHIQHQSYHPPTNQKHGGAQIHESISSSFLVPSHRYGVPAQQQQSSGSGYRQQNSGGYSSSYQQSGGNHGYVNSNHGDYSNGNRGNIGSHGGYNNGPSNSEGYSSGHRGYSESSNLSGGYNRGQSYSTGHSGGNGGFIGSSVDYTGNSGSFTGNSGGYTGNSVDFTVNSDGFTGNSGGFSGGQGGFNGNSGGFIGSTVGFSSGNVGFSGGSGGFSGGGNANSGGFSGGFNRAPTQTIVTKDVYVHAPPDDEPEEFISDFGEPAVNHKRYKIIFIKAPSPNIQQQFRVQQQATQQEKTIVYVLVKKPELATNIDLGGGTQNINSKPEVYFIKYKTNKQFDGGVGNSGGLIGSGQGSRGGNVGFVENSVSIGNDNSNRPSYGPKGYIPPEPLSSYR